MFKDIKLNGKSIRPNNLSKNVAVQRVSTHKCKECGDACAVYKVSAVKLASGKCTIKAVDEAGDSTKYTYIFNNCLDWSAKSLRSKASKIFIEDSILIPEDDYQTIIID